MNATTFTSRGGYHIPLDIRRPGAKRRTAVRAVLTSDSTSSKYGVPVLDTGDAIDYGPSEIVPRFGATAAELVCEAVRDSARELCSPFGSSMDDGHPDDQRRAAAHNLEGVRRFLAQWPEGPQV